ncbi:hypothetical protein [Tindallia californiensis]|uniref:Polar amino acid transport system substrate-binding protein n=1 Tax=Tindallia californiensis TaxID=159292 RepID=A0A1H3QRZ0_9FIRM|nr:hypothetical protein [Tindallia californiensis]SDZ16110.1 hypothetical protein SAMN05192546_11081 [Tindallia californiensis]
MLRKSAFMIVFLSVMVILFLGCNNAQHEPSPEKVSDKKLPKHHRPTFHLITADLPPFCIEATNSGILVDLAREVAKKQKWIFW